jgi:hypothetical protein
MTLQFVHAYTDPRTLPRTGGLPVVLTVEGTRAALPTGIDRAAYRIVQDAMTNALEHTNPPHARVTVRYATDALQLEVSDAQLFVRCYADLRDPAHRRACGHPAGWGSTPAPEDSIRRQRRLQFGRTRQLTGRHTGDRSPGPL